MLRMPIPERSHWRQQASEYGFNFHTMYGEPYWDESAYYQFTLKQIEEDIEDPTEEIHQMCLAVVDRVVGNDELLRKFQIPPSYWQSISDSWGRKDPSLYSRIDLAYDGQGPAKLYENNADTPTSVYETGFWQWLWLADNARSGHISRNADQFNSLQDKLVERFHFLAQTHFNETLHFACCKDTEEDFGTVEYLKDCAVQAGITCKFVYIEDIGRTQSGEFTDKDDVIVTWIFKLYPWEFMMHEEFGPLIGKNETCWLEPLWKSILSNKALLPLLWELFPNHPNLLPAYFEGDARVNDLKDYVKKPIFSREGANISVFRNGKCTREVPGPYGKEGYIIQAYHPLPQFGDNYTLIGSWLVNDKPAGISMREDKSLVTQDMSRYLPHIIQY
ncbi:MAG: glutathionylspermidine synthase family protein [Pseudomonadales bacterium]|nr:glutathionylspermidine synthase family protein [Pseudomonadales bacterium]